MKLAAHALALSLAASPALACSVPGDEGDLPLRRLVTRVKHLPETEAWELEARKSATVQYVLSLDAPREIEGRCYWPIEARSGGKLWHTFYTTPRGEFLLVAGPEGRLIPLEDWRSATR